MRTSCYSPARIAAAFGHGDIAQCVAERLGRIYGSIPFGASSNGGEAQLHRRVSAAKLNVDCKISEVDIPIAVPSSTGEGLEAQIVKWPVLLPCDLAKALVASGYEDLLLGDDRERSQYWISALKDYPRMATIDTLNSAPLAFYGDECTVFRQSVMCFHWQAALSPVSTDSLASRYLIAMVPSEYYWIAAWRNSRFGFFLLFFLP